MISVLQGGEGWNLSTTSKNLTGVCQVVTVGASAAQGITQGRFVPEQGKRFVVAAGDQRHLDAFAADLVAVQAAYSAYGLSQVGHLDGGL